MAKRGAGSAGAAARHRVASGQTAAGRPSTFLLRALILEDRPADAEIMVRELHKADWNVQWRCVHTKSQFVANLDPLPDIILADYAVPGFDALEALALLGERGLKLPFIVVTGSLSDEAAVECIKRGATDYLLKDRLARLPEAVARALEQERQRAAQENAVRALSDSERLNSAIIRSALDCVVSIDGEGRILEFNPAAELTFGLRREDAIGKPMADLIIPPRLREAHRRGFAHLLATGEGPILGKRVEMAGMRADGTEFPIELSITATGSWSAPIFTAYLRDISERRLAEGRIRRLNRVYAVLSGINTLIVRVRDREELLRKACRITVEHGGFSIAGIDALDPKTLVVTPVATAGIEDPQVFMMPSTVRRDMPGGQGLKERALRERRPVFDNDIGAHPARGGPRRKAALAHGLRSLIVLPLIVSDEVFGCLSLFAAEPNFFNEEEVGLLTELAGDIAFALENLARQAKLEKLSRIRAVSTAINATIIRVRERSMLLAETCRIAQKHGRFEMVWIAVLDLERQQVRPVAWAGFSEEAARAVSWTSITAAKGTLGEAIRTGKPAVRDDIETQLPAGKLRQEALQKGYRSTACVPVMADGAAAALIVLFAPGVGFFDDDELALLNEMAADISFALEAIERQEKLNHLAFYDALTGLPNRMLFSERLDRALHAAKQEGRKLALVFSDVKRLRYINESYGRQAGDALIREIAGQFRTGWPHPEHVARIAADCFAGILPDVRDAADVAHVVEGAVGAASARQFMIEGRELSVAMTAGIVIFPADGEDSETLCRNAEAALNKAKKAGENYLFYQPAMSARVSETLALESKLRKALASEQFVLHYQPKIAMAGGKISGLEALIRWNDPETGLVPPMHFVPLLEETGMIREAGQWAMRRALLDCSAWKAQGLTAPRVAVNVSAVQLRQKNFVDIVRLAIDGCGFAPHVLDLEITESLIMDDIAGNIEKLRAIRDMGVKISVDDFGTGHSSLSYLAKLPVDALKIDGSFIATMASSADSMNIVSTIISLAHSLNLKVIAEGVETEEQAKFLRLLKCDESQGYFFSRPLPFGDLADLLRGQTRSTPTTV